MKLLLLVHSEADVAHLGAAAQAIIASAVNRVWVVFSPAISVDVTEAAAKLDSEIATLRAAETQAATRTDYEAAKGYKAQREGKELDRQKALRDAWKTAPEEQRKARTKALFTPFMDTIQSVGGFSVKITGHSDHYDREQWVAMLNSLSGVWQKDFEPGSFLIGWPEGVGKSIRGMQLGIGPASPESELIQNFRRWFADGATLKATDPKIPTLQLIDGKWNMGVTVQGTSENNPPAPKTRRAELEAMHHSSVKKLARELGLDVADMSKDDVIEAVLNRETAPVAAEPVEAY